MKTSKELQKWLLKNDIKEDNLESVIHWLGIIEEYKDIIFDFDVSENGLILEDVIDFVNSTSPQTDLNPLVAQFEKVEKEIAKLRKLINKL